MNGLLGMLLATMFTTAIESDEEVVFYGCHAAMADDGQTWNAVVHGAVFEPETNSIKRRLLIGGIRRSLGIDKESDDGALFQKRARYFLVDYERGKTVSIRIGQREHALGTSAAGGQFEGRLAIPVDEADGLARDEAGAKWIDFEVVLPKGDERRFAGRIQLVPVEGLSIVSDIDDTIKLTDVRNRKEMLRNTFLRPFRPVDGMVDLYQRLARQGATFHYVSGGPWQLFAPLEAFRAESGFPAGTFHMRRYAAAHLTGLASVNEHGPAKEAAIEALLTAFPQRRFVLVGDTGEQDPEIYGKLAAKHAEQIVAVWIRNATDEQAADERFQQAFAGVAADRWKLFDSPAELVLPK
jgi:hypothetical protein